MPLEPLIINRFRYSFCAMLGPKPDDVKGLNELVSFIPVCKARSNTGISSDAVSFSDSLRSNRLVIDHPVDAVLVLK